VIERKGFGKDRERVASLTVGTANVLSGEKGSGPFFPKRGQGELSIAIRDNSCFKKRFQALHESLNVLVLFVKELPEALWTLFERPKNLNLVAMHTSTSSPSCTAMV